MPDPRGRLSEEEKRVATDWIAQKWKQEKSCPVCGTSAWTMGDHVVSFARVAADYWAIILACDNCGYMRLFNAVRIGLFSKE